jgi:hypothetical protein
MMIFRLFLILILLFTIVCGASCTKNSTSNRMANIKEIYSLPSDWPVPALDFTSDVILSKALSGYVDMPEMQGRKQKLWSAYAHCDGGWDGISKYMVAKLAPAGYKKLFMSPFEDSNHAEATTTYISSDGLIEIAISSDPSTMKTPAKDMSSADLTSWNDASQDFMIMINVGNIPGSITQRAMQAGPSDKIRLDPLQ